MSDPPPTPAPTAATQALEINPTTREPFLRLPPPHANLIITPPRLSDAPALVAILNDLRVVRTLSSPPFPYRLADAERWLAVLTAASERALAACALPDSEGAGGRDPAISIAGGERGVSFVDSCPLRYIREVGPDGADVLVGEVGVHRCAYVGVPDAEERARLAKANAALPAGHPRIVWCIGDFMAGSHHGRGIMTAALRTLMHGWMVPRMRARLIRVEAFVGNVGSVRVFEKNGFVVEETTEMEMVTNCGEKQTGYHILWWRADDA